MTRGRQATFAALLAAALLGVVGPARAVSPFGAAHAGARTEWWRASGHVRGADGRNFAYTASFFRFSHAGPPFLTAAVALAVEGTGRVTALRIERERPRETSASLQRLAVAIGDWSLAGDGPVAVHAGAGDASLALELTPAKPAVTLGGERGVPGACARCAVHVRAVTRMRTRGTVTAGGRTTAVDGISWLDQVWGDELLGERGAGWDWFELQLDDGADVLVEYPRDANGRVAGAARGVRVARDGSAVQLAGGDVSATVRGAIFWRSPATAARYPALWEVASGAARLAVSLSPVIADQEVRAPRMGEPYWDGAVVVHDDARGGARSGAGFVTLSGYARELRL